MMLDVRELSTKQWIAALSNTSRSLIQVGANDHVKAANKGDQDPVPFAIERGWRALLLEPVPAAYAKPSSKYADNPRVIPRLAAVCPPILANQRDPCANQKKTHRCDTPSAATSRLGAGLLPAVRQCNRSRHAMMWYVDQTNTSGNWGSVHADPRCINRDHHFLLELASFSVKQAKFARLPTAALAELRVSDFCPPRCHIIRSPQPLPSRACHRCSRRRGQATHQTPAGCVPSACGT